MLASLRLHMRALTLSPRVSSGMLGYATKEMPSVTTVMGDTATGDNDTAAFLNLTSPTELRTVKTVKRAIRASPRKLTYLAQQIRGLSANEAILQMKFSPKRKAEFFQKTVQNAINLADIKYQIEPENLMVAECFVNKGTYLKRLRIMGRGQSGVMHHPHAHITVVLREFDPSKKPLNRHLTKKLARESTKKMKWSEQLGAKIQTKEGLQDTDSKLAGKKVVGFYFSAHWCPPCRQFTPFLSAVYDDMIEEHPEFELIFISSDRDSSQFAEYFGEMPFLALPFEERTASQAMSTKFDVTGIPMLVFVDGEGKVITMDGRSVVADSRGNVEELWSKLTK